MMSIFTSIESDEDLEVEEAEEAPSLEESLILRAYSGRSSYKLTTVDVKLLLLLR